MEEENIANQAKLWNIIYGFSESLVLRCAVELDIANIIHKHGKSMTLSELASVLPVKQPVNLDSLFRVMRYLAHMQIFTKTLDADGETRYGLAPPAKLLVKGWDKCMVGGILQVTDKELMAPWHCIKDGIAGGSKTPFATALGANIWEYMEKQPEKNNVFNEAMAGDSRLMSLELINKCKEKFQGLNSLVDVAGGTGITARSIAQAFPSINCTVYDLPHVIASSPVYPEIAQVPGDMFKFIPYADAILLKSILHHWGDKECIEILKRCKDAVPKDGGKVIIVDIVLEVNSDHPFTKARLNFDLDMMISTGGKERTEEEWKTLIQAAGFKSYNISLKYLLYLRSLRLFLVKFYHYSMALNLCIISPNEAPLINKEKLPFYS